MMRSASYDVTKEVFDFKSGAVGHRGGKSTEMGDSPREWKVEESSDIGSETASLDDDVGIIIGREDGFEIPSGDDSLDKIDIDTGKGMVSFQPQGQENDEMPGPSGVTESQRADHRNYKKVGRRLPTTPEEFVISEDNGYIPSNHKGNHDFSESDLKEKGTSYVKYNSIPRSKKTKSKSKFYTNVDIRVQGSPSFSDHAVKSSDDDNFGADVRKATSASNLELHSTSKQLSPSPFSPSGNWNFRGTMSEHSRGDKNGISSKKSLTLSKSGVSLKQTHIGIFTFIPRHKDEVQFGEGDPLHVVKLHDDFWCEGINLITGKQGLFPCRYAADILSHHDGTGEVREGGDQFFLRFLGSVEVADFKGDDILCVAITKVVSQHKMLSTLSPQTCTLQISTKGIRISGIDGKSSPKSSPKTGRAKKAKGSVLMEVEASQKGTHFFSMKNVTYCGNHPRDRRYFAFITKHPSDHRYACHVFMSQYSTDQITVVVGTCFKKFYDDYLEYRAPTEDIYIE